MPKKSPGYAISRPAAMATNQTVMDAIVNGMMVAERVSIERPSVSPEA